MDETTSTPTVPVPDGLKWPVQFFDFYISRREQLPNEWKTLVDLLVGLTLLGAAVLAIRQQYNKHFRPLRDIKTISEQPLLQTSSSLKHALQVQRSSKTPAQAAEVTEDLRQYADHLKRHLNAIDRESSWTSSTFIDLEAEATGQRQPPPPPIDAAMASPDMETESERRNRTST